MKRYIKVILMNKNMEINIFLFYIISFLIIMYGYKVDGIEIVIARYRENLEWTNNDLYRSYKITCYNKGGIGYEIDRSKYRNIDKIIELENYGNSENTYMRHIIDNYDNLSDITIFMNGESPVTKTRKTIITFLTTLMTRRTTFYCSKYDMNINKCLYNFTIKYYKHMGKSNRNKDNYYLKRASISPFGKWYNYIFGNDKDIRHINYQGVFSVERRHIIQHSREYYEKINGYIDKDINPETCHYVERAMTTIFYPYDIKTSVYDFYEEYED
jgi:hypothetical protein